MIGAEGHTWEDNMIIQSLLDTDLYKFTMQQVVFHKFPFAEVEYTFQCRTAGADLAPYADEIRAEIDAFCALSFTDDEIAYLRTIRFLNPSYVDALKNLRLRCDQIAISTENGFELSIKGNWYQTILFEVPLLAVVNEVYFRHTHPNAPERDPAGRERLAEKVQLLREHAGPKINLIEFGTRRRYSREWQRTVLETLKRDAGPALIGSSNVLACKELGLKPYGTMAHEYLQACQVFAPLPEFQRFALETWMQEYRGDLGIALSDVVGMRAFLDDFDKLFCKAYDGARHDSGDPYEWGDMLIEHYKNMGVDPRVKSGVFSDGLDIPKVIDLARYFDGRLHTMFGVGTNLTNDFSFKALNIVLKMTKCNGRPVAKLSDSPGKTMCKDEVYLAYLREAFGLTK
jgi:nicotinate phosphoribosyltransferase